jgi:hypothetical protein
MVRYYGWYSNVLRGMRLKEAEDDGVPCLIDADRAPAAYRKSWAGLIKKIYEADPLLFPKLVPAKAGMQRTHAGHQLYRRSGGHPHHPATPRPLSHPLMASSKAHAPPAVAPAADESNDLLPHTPVYGDPQYPWEAYL